LIVYADMPYTRQALAARLGIKPENVIERPGQDGDVDLEVILGRDYAQRIGKAE